MKNTVSARITDSLVSAGAVPSEDKALYEYGIRMGILMVINVATALLIGLLLDMLWQSIVFLIAYNPVRSYAGGYHASSQLNCYLISIPMILAVLFGIKLVPWNDYISMIVLLGAAIMIEILAPVEDSHKPLRGQEKAVYKRKARLYSGLIAGAAIVLWFLDMKQISLSIIMALVVAAVMLILGAIKNKIN